MLPGARLSSIVRIFPGMQLRKLPSTGRLSRKAASLAQRLPSFVPTLLWTVRSTSPACSISSRRCAARLSITFSAAQSVMADAAYDGAPTYEGITAHGDDIEVVIPPRSTAVPSGATGPPTQRDLHVAMVT